MGKVVYSFQKRLQRKSGAGEDNPELNKMEWSMRALNNDMAKAERRVARFLRMHKQQEKLLNTSVSDLQRLKEQLTQLEEGSADLRRDKPRQWPWWLLAALTALALVAYYVTIVH